MSNGRDEPLHPTARKVQERLAARGLDVEVQVLPGSTRTAQDAAEACGCEIGQIVKSLIFLRDDEPVIVLCAGDRHVDEKGLRLVRADADTARESTGFAVGGVPPLGHDRELPTIVDESLRRYDTIWAAAGTPNAVFSVQTDALLEALPSFESWAS